MSESHRSSYLKTIVLAFTLATLIAGITSASSFALGWPSTIALVVGCTAAAILLAVSVAGALVVRRDTDAASGRGDLFAKANARRSEATLALGSLSREPLLPKLWRAITRHSSPVVGERVRIRSLDDIRATLDAAGCLDGLPFMPEMARFCGQAARVYRSVDKVYDYGGAKNLRRMKDAVLLTELRCDGSEHGGCQARCYLIWKTAWLARVRSTVDGPEPLPTRRPPAATQVLSAATSSADSHQSGPSGRYRCQFTQLVAATSPMSARDPRQDLRALLEGNVTITAFAVALLTRLFNGAQRLRSGTGYPFRPESHRIAQHSAQQGLRPNDLVRVQSREAIAATLDSRGRNRGLWFDLEMLKHCGHERRVSTRIERIIDDASGKMLQMKTPCVVLDSVQASGEFLRFCPQEELIYWREAWLVPLDRPRSTPLDFSLTGTPREK